MARRHPDAAGIHADTPRASLARCACYVFALAAAVACTDTSPRVVSLSPDSIAAYTAQNVSITTQGCAPPYDLNSGAVVPDSSIALWLNGATTAASVRRTGSESFDAVTPNTLGAGSYAVMLVLGDGRRASFDGALLVVAAHPDAASADAADAEGTPDRGAPPDALPTTCAPNEPCSCSGGAMCELRCSAGGACAPSCSGGSICSPIGCTGTTSCIVTCSGGSTCDVDCVGATQCKLSCSGCSPWLVLCGTPGSCGVMSCTGGSGPVMSGQRSGLQPILPLPAETTAATRWWAKVASRVRRTAAAAEPSALAVLLPRQSARDASALLLHAAHHAECIVESHCAGGAASAIAIDSHFDGARRW